MIRRCLGWATLAISIGGVCLAVKSADLSPRSESNGELDPFAAFCLTVPQAAVVSKATPSGKIISVRVPNENPLSQILDDRDLGVTQVMRGEIVEFKVSAARKGAVAVHGLSDIAVLRNGTATVRFRAIYSGRFPLHFHGLDQSHFEVAVLEVRS